MFQACDSGWRCDIKCRALAHTRKCAFFPLVSVPCFCDQRERNLTGDVLPSASRQCSVRLQQSAHVFAFSLLSSNTVPVCWSCADSSTHLRWLKTSSWWKKTRCIHCPPHHSPFVQPFFSTVVPLVTASCAHLVAQGHAEKSIYHTRVHQTSLPLNRGKHS